jgi:hypothetical protein
MTDTPEILQDEQDRINKLKDKELLLKLVEEIQKEGVIGEEETIFVLINKIMLRLANSDPTSSNIIISDETGGGKDYIVTKTCNVLLPKNKYHHRTDISDKTFDYWKPIIKWEKNEEGKRYPVYDTWNEHVLHLEDPREEALNCQSFKVMSSGGTEVTKVIEHKAKDIKIEGKPVIIVTSLKTLIENEGVRRWDTLRIDTTTEQTRAINKFKLLKASGKIEYNPDKTLREALQTNLYKKNVIIPFAIKIFGLLPDSIITRTQTDKLLDYIKASAILYQHQREKIDDSTILADGFDLAYAWFVFIVLNGSQGIPTNRDEEELVKVLIDSHRPVSINELSTLYPRHSKQWIYINREKLVNKGLIKTSFEFDVQSNKEIEMLSVGNNSMLVLTGFNEVLKYFDKISFNGFNGFKEICMHINDIRKKEALKPTFSQVFVENHENHENLSVEAIIKPQENQIKPLSNKIQDLKEYCEKIKSDGHKITYENLCFNFDKSFIEKCKEKKILVLLSDGSYDFGGGK